MSMFTIDTKEKFNPLSKDFWVKILITSIAKSVRFIASRVFCFLKPPKEVVSSVPAVSISTQAPILNNSADFLTVSVVVPLCGDTIAVCCPVRIFIRVLLPALQRPKIPICNLFSLCVCVILVLLFTYLKLFDGAKIPKIFFLSTL